MNGSGKSTVGLRGLMACINGIAEKKGGILGERFRFIGKNGASADVEYEFIDEKTEETFTIRNHITKQSNNITFKSSGSAPIGDDWLKGFLNTSLMSARAFCGLSGIEQARALGIDTTSFDEELKGYKTEATGLNARLKAFGTIEGVEEVLPIDLTELDNRHKEITNKLNDEYKKNREENSRRRREREELIEQAKKSVEIWQADQSGIEARLNVCVGALNVLTEEGYDGKEVQLFIDALPRPEKHPPEEMTNIPDLELIDPEMPDSSELTVIEEEKSKAFETNIKAERYQVYISKKAEKEEVERLIAENKKNQAQCIESRGTYMASHNLGFKGLSIDEEGYLILNDRPINENYFSTGELEIIVAKMHAAQNPEFKCRFIDDFERIDENNQEIILKELIDAGFQIIIAEVGEGDTGKENVIVLEECRIKDEGEDKPELI